MFGLGRFGFLRLRRKQGGHNSNQHKRSHCKISQRVCAASTEIQILKSSDQIKGAGGRYQRTDAISRHISRASRRLFALAKAFNAECVDKNILRGRRGGDEKCRTKYKVPGHVSWIAYGEHYNRDDQDDLRQ